MNMTETSPGAGECTCKSYQDHCPACESLEAANAPTVKATRRAVRHVVPTPAPAPAADLWVTPKDLAHKLRVATRTIWRMIERGDLPKPIQFTRKLLRWRYADVLTHLEAIRQQQADDAQRAG